MGFRLGSKTHSGRYQLNMYSRSVGFRSVPCSWVLKSSFRFHRGPGLECRLRISRFSRKHWLMQVDIDEYAPLAKPGYYAHFLNSASFLYASFLSIEFLLSRDPIIGVSSSYLHRCWYHESWLPFRPSSQGKSRDYKGPTKEAEMRITNWSVESYLPQ